MLPKEEYVWAALFMTRALPLFMKKCIMILLY